MAEVAKKTKTDVAKKVDDKKKAGAAPVEVKNINDLGTSCSSTACFP